MRRLGDSELDQSKDTELCVEQFSLFESHTAVLLKEGVEVLDKGRIELEEGGVESLVEILQFGFILISREGLLELVKVARTHRQVESEVLFLGSIRLHQLKVGLSESLLSLSDRGIGLGKLGILCLDGPGFGLSGVVEIESDHSHKKQEESNHHCNEQVMRPFLGLLLLDIYICLLNQRHC